MRSRSLNCNIARPEIPPICSEYCDQSPLDLFPPSPSLWKTAFTAKATVWLGERNGNWKKFSLPIKDEKKEWILFKNLRRLIG
jgi:hypothetical protein